ncbi:hypothetical protein ACGFXC_33810 [Streptomyces sp. NPDC048507]|uniref:hypothetical protein n=1 Tax=Streptomyces sp. NPDC048507 TaxID=3365560 RepID=UPI0037167BFA
MSLSHVVLSSGRSIELTELRMSSTYGGLIEGYPFKRVNDMQVERLRREAERDFTFAPVHLVQPSREYPDHFAGAFGPAELLPHVTCIGVFRSTPVDPGLDPVLHRSSLTVAWFQNLPHVPSGQEADPALRDTPWDEFARDYEI